MCCPQSGLRQNVIWYVFSYYNQLTWRMGGSLWHSAWLTLLILVRKKIFCQLRQLCKDIEYGVLQGSILGPILFSLYHCYANDTQLYVFVSPDNPSPLNALTSGWVKGFYNKWAENRSPTCWSKSWKAEDWDSVC